MATQDLESPSCLGRFFPMARYFVRNGNEVVFITLHSQFDPSGRNEFTKDGVKVRYAGQMHVGKKVDSKSYFPTLKLLSIAIKATLAFTHAALTIPCDIIYICKPHPMNSLAAFTGKLLRRKIVFLDYDDYEAAIGHFSGKWQKAIIAFFENTVPKFVDHISTHTEFLRQRLLDLGISTGKVSYIPSGVDEDRFQQQQLGNIIEIKNKMLLEEKRVVGFVGSLSLPSHPVELLLEAFEIVHRVIPNCILLLVGGGEQIEALKVRGKELGILDDMRFAGRVPPDEIQAYYRLADVIVDPVLDDPIARGRLPLKMLESWMMGIPFVSADVGDRRCLLGNPPAGLLASPGDINDMANCIMRVLEDDDLAITLRENGLNRARDFSWDNVMKEIIPVLERIAIEN